MSRFLYDLRHALRSLAGSPWVSVTAVLSLALGIGANTTIFTLVNAVLLHGVPAAEPDRLVSIYTVNRTLVRGPRASYLPTSLLNFEDYRDGNEVLDSLVAYLNTPLAMRVGQGAVEVSGQVVSPGFFELMGLRPARGRFFSAEENGETRASPVIVLSYGFWESRFGRAPGAIGESVSLNGRPYEVIGVAPRGFTGPDLAQTPDLWVPMGLHDQLLTGTVRRFFERRRGYFLRMVGRLSDGVTLAQAQSSLEILAAHLSAQNTDDYPDSSLGLVPLLQANVRPDQRAVFTRAGSILLLVVGLVLVIVCVNVAHLLMIRADRRRGEMSLRLALGASRRTLTRQLFLEGIVLVTAGALLGLLLALLSRETLWALRPPMLANARPDLGFDLTVLTFTAAVALGATLLTCLAPALKASDVALTAVLRGERPIGGTNRLWNPRGLLIVAQVALCTITSTLSGLFVASLQEAREVDVGFEHERVAVIAYNLGTLGYDEDRGRDFNRRVLTESAGLPEARATALATTRPFNPRFGGVLRAVVPEGKDPEDARSTETVTSDFVSTGYFEVLGLPILRGRGFTEADREDAPQTAVVNETLGRLLWPGEEAVGRRLTVVGLGECEVVGQVRDSLNASVTEAPAPYLYLPLEQHYHERLQLFVRADGSPARLLRTVAGKVREIDPALPLSSPATLPEEVEESLWALRLGARLMGGFALLALVLAVVGVHAVVSYTVALRGRELAVRAALGAERRSLLRMILVRCAVWTAAGVVVGWIATVLLSPLVSDVLFGIRATDPKTFGLTSLLLAAAALLASLAPAYRATTVDPARVLREE